MTKISEFGLTTLDPVNVLAKGNFWMQALTVLYSAIDTVAWSTKDAGDVTRSDFFSRVAKYMQPETTIGCSAEDLYAARCGVVHSGASESRMSREGDATELWYVTAPARKSELEALWQGRASRPRLCTQATLSQRLPLVERFSNELETDVNREARVAARIGRWLGFVPAGTVVNSK